MIIKHLLFLLLIFRQNPNKFSNDEINSINDWFRWDFYKISREKNYKNIQKKIIIEPVLFNDKQISDFKIFTYKGKVKIFQVVIYKNNKKVRNFFDINWKKMPFSIYDKPYEGLIQKPKLLNEMIRLAENISKDFKFLRVDLYTNDKEIYVGELTHHPGNHGDIFLDINGNYVGHQKEIEYSSYFIS